MYFSIYYISVILSALVSMPVNSSAGHLLLLLLLNSIVYDVCVELKVSSGFEVLAIHQERKDERTGEWNEAEKGKGKEGERAKDC